MTLAAFLTVAGALLWLFIVWRAMTADSRYRRILAVLRSHHGHASGIELHAEIGGPAGLLYMDLDRLVSMGVLERTQHTRGHGNAVQFVTDNTGPCAWER